MRYRKSINLGGGFRVNISKSGIGYSWGTRGARITKTARGTTRTTLSIPGTGLSYVTEKGGRAQSKSLQRNGSRRAAPNQDQQATNNPVSTEKINADDYQSAEYKDLLTQMGKALKLNRLSNWLIATVVFAAFPLFALTAIVGVVLKVFVRTKMKVPMEYSFDSESQAAYGNLSAIWMSLNNNQQFWQTVSETSLDQKRSGGASRGVNRVSIKAIGKLPFFVETNIQPFGLQLRKKKVYFFPDKVLVISKTTIGAINYSDIQMKFGSVRFVETESVPKDAKVVGQTWLKVNKNGTPDKRFKDNRQVPVCEYGTITIESGAVLHIELMCSNIETINEMRQSAALFAQSIS